MQTMISASTSTSRLACGSSERVPTPEVRRRRSAEISGDQWRSAEIRELRGAQRGTPLLKSAAIRRQQSRAARHNQAARRNQEQRVLTPEVHVRHVAARRNQEGAEQSSRQSFTNLGGRSAAFRSLIGNRRNRPQSEAAAVPWQCRGKRFHSLRGPRAPAMRMTPPSVCSAACCIRRMSALLGSAQPGKSTPCRCASRTRCACGPMPGYLSAQHGA